LSQGSSAVPDAPFALDTFELVLYSSNPGAPSREEGESRRIVAEHLAWAGSQLADGNAVLAGAIAGHPLVSGLGLFCTGSLERTRTLMATDPAISSGLDTYHLARFVTRAGLIRRPESSGRGSGDLGEG
jgi:hypothetical protein